MAVHADILESAQRVATLPQALGCTRALLQLLSAAWKTPAGTALPWLLEPPGKHGSSDFGPGIEQ